MASSPSKVPSAPCLPAAMLFLAQLRGVLRADSLLALSLQALANKMEVTYPCPPGCEERELQCFACAPGFARQANGRICTPRLGAE